MKAMRFIVGFLFGLVAGYFIVLFGWVAYTNLVGVRDFEGAASMQVAFFFAPLGGIIRRIGAGSLVADAATLPSHLNAGDRLNDSK
jgi:hypothetical protein